MDAPGPDKFAASKPKPIKITGVPGPGVKIIMILRTNNVNPARIRKTRRTCSVVPRIMEARERIFLAQRVGFSAAFQSERARCWPLAFPVLLACSAIAGVALE